jgi:hypothetical protein
MSGKEIFDHHQAAAMRCGFGSKEFSYGNLLYEALKIGGEDTVFRMLEEANLTGKRIELNYSLLAKNMSAEPDIVVLV